LVYNEKFSDEKLNILKKKSALSVLTSEMNRIRMGDLTLSTLPCDGSFRRALQSANPAQRLCRTGPPVYIGWNRIHPRLAGRHCYSAERAYLRKVHRKLPEKLL
jgi:hypothetical protein